MDSGNRLVAGSSDSEAQLDSVVATVHSPVPCAHAAFPDIFGMMFVALRHWRRMYSAAGTAGCWDGRLLGRQAAAALAAAHAVSVVDRDRWHGEVLQAPVPATLPERASWREVENGPVCVRGRRERPRGGNAARAPPSPAPSLVAGARWYLILFRWSSDREFINSGKDNTRARQRAVVSGDNAVELCL